ncbi:hypothetical protein SAMN04488540_102282 [Ferrimonas sediminum]|uniref:DUF695 domain-containing protein n=1 Tax=Ferrimonas sediminum TaxID=718193 RepID=A0A1G8M6G3_9GAMM|nr:hypothetical protein [Ferrimonas sediminum]SDI63528.1 hypothetical protein SAMN04488540_102282 [Ferrimonas sediminum]
MKITAVAEFPKPEVKRHHKPRHLKKLAIGEFASTCVHIRFDGDIALFEKLDEAVFNAANDTVGTFLAYFNNQYHVAIHFFTAEASIEEQAARIAALIEETLGSKPELTIFAGDENYGDWDATFQG